MSFVSGFMGFARIDRLPRARGPYSIRPLNRATTLPRESRSAISVSMLPGWWLKLNPAFRTASVISLSPYSLPR